MAPTLYKPSINESLRTRSFFGYIYYIFSSLSESLPNASRCDKRAWKEQLLAELSKEEGGVFVVSVLQLRWFACIVLSCWILPCSLLQSESFWC